MRFAFLCLMLILSCSAKAIDSVYGGLELQVRNMGVKKSVIGAFHNAHLQPNVLIGAQLNQRFGVEGGVNICRFRHQGKNFHKSNALHLGLVGNLPLDEKFELIGGLGVSRVKVAYYNCKLQTKMRKAVPRGLIGLHYCLTEDLKIRASVAHEHTSKIRNGLVSAKDSTSYSLGVISSF